MAYEVYVTVEYYRNTYDGVLIPEDDLEKALKQASRHGDSLTYNRIVGRGLRLISRKSSGKSCVCRQISSMRTRMRLIACYLRTVSMECLHSSAAAGMCLRTRV